MTCCYVFIVENWTKRQLIFDRIGEQWHTEIVIRLFIPERGRFPRTPALLLHNIQFVGTGVMWIQHKEFQFVGLAVVVNAENRVRQNSAADHDRCTVCREMLCECRSMLSHICSGIHVNDARVDIQKMLQTHGHLRRTDPLSRIQECFRFVAQLDQTLLNFCMRRNTFRCVALMAIPREQRLEWAIRTTPAIVVEIVLHVMMIRVFAFDNVLLAVFHCNRIIVSLIVANLKMNRFAHLPKLLSPTCGFTRYVSSAQFWKSYSSARRRHGRGKFRFTCANFLWEICSSSASGQ